MWDWAGQTPKILLLSSGLEKKQGGKTTHELHTQGQVQLDLSLSSLAALGPTGFRQNMMESTTKKRQL